MMIFWLLVLVLLAYAVWAYAARGAGRADGDRPRTDRAESLLRERYARGEIDEPTFRRMLDELRNGAQ